MTTPPPRLVPDRPSDAAIAEILEQLDGDISLGRMRDGFLSPSALVWVSTLQRARDCIASFLAAAPPAEAPGDRSKLADDMERWLDDPFVVLTPMRRMDVEGFIARLRGPNFMGEPLAAAPAAPATVPADVMAALDRMCTPLDPSWIKGATMKRDAECMAIIRDYILSAPRVTGGRDSERLDYLLANQANVYTDGNGGWWVQLDWAGPEGTRVTPDGYPSKREAIDAAMAKEQTA